MRFPGTVKDIHNLAIDNLIQANRCGEVQWIPCSNIIEIRPSQIENIYYATRKQYGDVILILLGSNERCTPTLVSEFARIYSFPTHEYHGDVNNFKRYTEWLNYRNRLICGFTEYDNSYYMVADKRFYYHYSRYGFCSACRILRCSPVWCVCGHKELSDGWTSKNKQLDEFIKKSQLRTNSANDAYLEWIPFDCIHGKGYNEGYGHLHGLPTRAEVKLTPLEKTDEYYDKLCDEHPDIPTTDVWVTTGFTYDAKRQKYCLIKEWNGNVLCLACTKPLECNINSFCYHCKAPRPLDWTTGNKSLDLFIMESWSNMTRKYDAYIQWIEYSLLSNVQKTTLLHHGCTHIADWLEPISNRRTKVVLKKIVNKHDGQAFDFNQLTKNYPEILTPDNIWILGITQESSTGEYYLVFYHEIHTILDRFMQHSRHVEYIQYGDFDEIKEIGSGGYGTVYTARYKRHSEVWHMPEIVVLKRFKNFDQMPELFISELRNHAKCLRYDFLQLYGVTQDPETKEYIIVMQYANNGSLSSYLGQTINQLTWKMKLRCLKYIAFHLSNIHRTGLVHCDLHGGNVVMHETRTFICDLGHSRSTKSFESLSALRGVLLFTAPEVFHTRKFTQKSDIYSFGIIMYLIATGQAPFRERQQFDGDLICDIMGGLRPVMPDEAPEEYKKLAEWCCDADPDKRPDAMTISDYIDDLIKRMRRDNSYNDIWDTIYHNNDVRPLSGFEENNYSSKLLPTRDLPRPRYGLVNRN